MNRWRLLPYHVGRSDVHFALSDALARTSRRPTIWWHSTDQPTLILGPTQVEFDTRACEESGVLVVRRQAGGTAVYAAPGVLGLDVMIPSGHPRAYADIHEAYRWLGETWSDALQHLGADTRLVSVEEARASTLRAQERDEIVRMACFGALSPYEVVVDERKLVGLAQVRRRAGILLQSAVHLHFDARALAELLPSDGDGVEGSLAAAAIGLDEALATRVSELEVMTAFGGSLTERSGMRMEEGTWAEEELQFLRERYPDIPSPHAPLSSSAGPQTPSDPRKLEEAETPEIDATAYCAHL